MPIRSVRTFVRTVLLCVLIAQAIPLRAAPPVGDQQSSPPGAPAKDAKSALSELQKLTVAVQAQSELLAEQSRQIESERASIADELRRIAALELRLGASATPSVGSPHRSPIRQALVAGTPLPASQHTVEVQTPQDLSNRIANLEQRVKTFGPFTFSGDIRLREEPFFGGPSDGSLDQNRVRFRLRFNVKARLNDDFSSGFSLASGDINNPVSDNQSITGFYSRKSIAIDTAFISYSPHQFDGLSLLAGKFAYPWYNTELVWDKDLNPEGAAETLAFDLHTPVLKKVAFVGFELPFSQVAGVSAANTGARENVVYGGQIQTNWQLARWFRFGAFSGYYHYTNADPIALAVQTALSKYPQTPLTGLLPLAGTTVENSIITTTATSIVTIGGSPYSTGLTKVTNAQFASKFGLFDSLARFDFATPWENWPVRLIGDYVQNTEACGNLRNIQPPPAETASLHFSQSRNFACDSRQRRGYWGEIQVGRAQKKGDWELDYTRMFIEREAVMSAFNYSEIYQGSNVSEHRAEIIYQAHRNVQLSFTGLFGRPLNFGSAAPPQNWLERLQFDMIYSF